MVTIMSETATMDTQGRIYLPKIIRETLGIHPGTIFYIEVENGKIVLKERKSIIMESKGIYKTEEPIEDIDELIKEGTFEEVKKDL